MIAIGRPINGVFINGLEYLLDEDGDYLLFPSIDAAKDFIAEYIPDPSCFEYIDDSDLP
jgi:hypothetical protein